MLHPTMFWNSLAFTEFFRDFPIPVSSLRHREGTYIHADICMSHDLSVKALHLPLSLSLSLHLCLWVDTILEDVQIVGGSYGNDILRWVPSHVQNFLSEVQAVNAHISTATLTASIHSPGPQHCPRLAALSPSLKCYASPCLPVKHPEETVVRTGHDDTEERIDEHWWAVRGTILKVKTDLMSVKLLAGNDLNAEYWQSHSLIESK